MHQHRRNQAPRPFRSPDNSTPTPGHPLIIKQRPKNRRHHRHPVTRLAIASLHTPARVWAGREAGDSIKYVPHLRLFGLGFGTDPMTNGFGARLFATGTSGHSGYLDPGSASLRSLTEIALGNPAAVTR